jgi:glutaredoxin
VNVILYTRAGCHLCDDARAVLVDHGIVPITVDIDADPALRARFNECVPVVEIDGRVRFRGRVDPVLLRRLIAASG